MMAMDLTGSTENRHEYDIRDYRRRIATLEERVAMLTGHVEALSTALAMCFDYLGRIEQIDMDAMRMVSMYVGYSEGEQ